MKENNIKIAYFGGQPLGAGVLKILLEKNITPELVVTVPDKKSGRGQKTQENEIKKLARENAITTFQPESLKNRELLSPILEKDWDLFVVVSYPKILPEWLIEIPKHKTLNLHPSLLPKYRGVSPIRSAILNNDKVLGTSVMLLDKEMDHGPILAQEELDILDTQWPPSGLTLDKIMIEIGGEILAETIKGWVKEEITPTIQNHEEATYTQKFTREDGELQIDPFNLPTGDEAYTNLLKIKAFDGWPGTFFFHNNRRIKITDASIDQNKTLKINSVTPEGKNNQPFTKWLEAQRL